MNSLLPSSALLPIRNFSFKYDMVSLKNNTAFAVGSVFLPFMYHTGCCHVLQEFEGIVERWCNPLTLQSEQSGRVGSKPARAQLLERHDKGWTRLALCYFCDPSTWC